MDEGKLFVSFWELCLDNLPLGTFTHRRISAEEARVAIQQSLQDGRLLCVSGADLLAPYRKHERENHSALRKVLGENFGIALTISDFLIAVEDGDDPLQSITPLSCVKIRDNDRLMVITCSYTFGKKTQGPLAFDIEPSTVEFHLLESA